MLRIHRASPMHTIQDLGRFGFAGQGVAQAGPMDSIAACWANYVLGNHTNLPLIEIGGGGFSAEFTQAVNFGISGAWGAVSLDGKPLPGPGSYHAKSGDIFSIGRLSSGIFSYLAVEGGFLVTPVLGSTATCRRDSLGGSDGDGASLKQGSEIRYRVSQKRDPFLIPRQYLVSYSAPLVCDVLFRDSMNFDQDAYEIFLNQAYTVSKEQSRMGYRLDGECVIEARRPRYSAPIPLGGVQIPPSGQPIVLMRDHQSLGGYPMIGTLTRRSLSHLAQRAPGNHVSFRTIDRNDAFDEFEKYQRFFGAFR